MIMVSWQALRRLGVLGAYQALYHHDSQFRLEFQEAVRDEILHNIPPHLLSLTTPETMVIMVDFSMLLMFQPDSFFKDRIIEISPQSLKRFSQEADDPVRPALRNFEKLQPYVRL